MSDSQCHLVTTTSFHSIAIGNSSAAGFPSGLSLRRLQIVGEVTTGAVCPTNGGRAEPCPPQRRCDQLLWRSVMAEVHSNAGGDRSGGHCCLCSGSISGIGCASPHPPRSSHPGEREGVLLTPPPAPPLDVEATPIRNSACISPTMCFYIASPNKTCPQCSC